MKRVFLLTMLCSVLVNAADIRVTVSPERVSRIDHRLFGHFLERPSWGGEFGIEDAVLPGTEKLDPRVLKKLKGLEIPVLRFPGGTDVDYMDWTDLIDLPEREKRPVSIGNSGNEVTNRFGYDEFYELTKKLDSEAILPFNFFDSYLKRIPLEDAALHQVGLVAYCNAHVGQKLPEGMRDWPSVRAENGYKKPFKFRYVQIGNETWALWGWKKKMLEEMNFADAYGWYIDCVRKHIDLIEAVDPEIEIIADFVNMELFDKMHAEFGERIDYYVFHRYQPWGMKAENVSKDGNPYPLKKLTDEEVWNAFVSTPCAFDENGMTLAWHELLEPAREQGFQLAITEWNWNGWWEAPDDEKPLESFYAHGVGAAGFLHSFIRHADVIKMANQSMLVGSSWGITGIRVDKEGIKAPHYHPTAQMTSFYGEHHGDYLLKSTFDNVPVYKQPYRLANIRPSDKVATVDILTTGSDKKVSVFMINRDFDSGQTVTIDLSAFAGNSKKAEWVIAEGVLNDANVTPPDPYMTTRKEKVKSSGKTITVTLPKRTVSVLHIGVKP